MIQKGETGMFEFSGTNWKNSPTKSGGIGHFPVLALFFHLSPSKKWLTYPYKLKLYVFNKQEYGYHFTKFGIFSLIFVFSGST